MSFRMIWKRKCFKFNPEFKWSINWKNLTNMEEINSWILTLPKKEKN